MAADKDASELQPPAPTADADAPVKETEEPTSSTAADPEAVTTVSMDENTNPASSTAQQEETPASATEPTTETFSQSEHDAFLARHDAYRRDMDIFRVAFDAYQAALNSGIEARSATLAKLRAEMLSALEPLDSSPAVTVKTHIELLHQYNEIRDVGQGLIGMVAENRGVRVGELYGEFGVGADD